MPRRRHDRSVALPTVTVFGAGIAGLTTAHELAERGFPVQVVEPAESPFVEYECQVGGLAANQFARARMPLETLHDWLSADEKNYRLALAWRNQPLEQTQARYPLKQRIGFDKRLHGGGPTLPDCDVALSARDEPPPPPPGWLDYKDQHGVANSKKINDAFEIIHDAALFYMRLYFPKLAQALDFGEAPTDLQWIDRTFTPLQWDPGTDAENAVHAALAKKFVARETYCLTLVGYTDTDGLAEINRRIACYWATTVCDQLLSMNKALAEAEKAIFQLEDRLLDIDDRGGADPTFPQSTALGRALSNRVEFSVIEQVLPGEHGFRFFPAFYRNLFDTMRRTPVFEPDGDIAGTAFDQLVPTPQPAVAAGLGGQPQVVDSKPTSLWQIDQALNLLRNDLGFTVSDLFGLQYYMLRFLTSCGGRREREAEPVDMMTYMGGPQPQLRFSQAAIDFLTNAPRALAAMSATESDARTQLDVAAQLLMVNLFGPQPDNMTLNGPTSAAWLDRWKTYLVNQGVTFYVGKLKALKTVEKNQVEHLVPDWSKEAGSALPTPEDPENAFAAPPDDGSDIEKFRFVSAMTFQQTSKLLWSQYHSINRTVSPFEQFLEFELHAGRRKRPTKADPQSGPIPPSRDPATGRETGSNPLRTISGVQLFFAEDYRFGVGNVYFARTPWDLTSISQLSYWQDVTNPLGQFHGQLSIDVGAWHAFAQRDRGRPTGKASDSRANAALDHDNTAWYSSASEIAGGVWAQVRAGFATPYQVVVRAPRYAHLDRNIVFSRIIDPKPRSADVPAVDTSDALDANGVGAELKPYTFRMEGAVRANAIVGVSKLEAGPRYPFDLNTDYQLNIAVGAGSASTPFHAKGANAEAVIKSLTDAINQDPGRHAIAAALETTERHELVISPVCHLPSALIRLREPTTHRLHPGGRPGPEDHYSVRLGSKQESFADQSPSPKAVRDRILVWIEANLSKEVAVEAVGDDGLWLTSLATLRDGSPKPLAMAVLNADSRIDVIGSPALALETVGLYIRPPREGFCVLRNEAEFLINVPDQWRWRPGLRRESDGIPRRYSELAACFGDPDTEIYYGVDNDPPQLEYWTAAGTYMATYTRMTTMEAANESGRHAAAAVIYKLLADADRATRRRKDTDPGPGPNDGLVANFPTIWRVEDYEYDDLKFAKNLDAGLLAAGLPHALDILGITDLVNRLLATSVDDPGSLTQAIQMLRAALSSPQLKSIGNLKALASGFKSLFGAVL